MIGHSKIHNLLYVKVFLTKSLDLVLFFFHVSKYIKSLYIVWIENENKEK